MTKCLEGPQFHQDREYYSKQRRRNPPEEESVQGIIREPATGLARHSGDWMPKDETEEALTMDVITEQHGKADVSSQVPTKPGMTMS